MGSYVGGGVLCGGVVCVWMDSGEGDGGGRTAGGRRYEWGGGGG